MLLLAGLLLACSVSRKDAPQELTQAEIQAAIEQTFAAGATATFTATLPPTDPPPTAVPTDTPTPIPTNTPTTIPTNTPTITATPDQRVIQADPSQFQLKKDDLPWRGEYFIPGSDWVGPNTNDEVIATWDDPVQAREYLAESGRVTGYEVFFKRGNTSAPLPQEVGCVVVQYRTIEGAQRAVTEFTFASRNLDENWVSAEVTLPLGAVSNAEYLEKMDSGGNLNLKYWVSTSHRNLLIECVGWGAKANVTPEFVEDLVQKMLEKVQAAELVEPSQWLQGATPAP